MKFIVLALALVLAACQASGPSTFTHTFDHNDRDTNTPITQVQETPTVEVVHDNTSQTQSAEVVQDNTRQPDFQPAPPVNPDCGFCN